MPLRTQAVSMAFICLASVIAPSPKGTIVHPNNAGAESKATKVVVQVLKTEKFANHTRAAMRVAVSLGKDHAFDSYFARFLGPKGKEYPPRYTKSATPHPGKTTVIEFFHKCMNKGRWKVEVVLKYKQGHVTTAARVIRTFSTRH